MRPPGTGGGDETRASVGLPRVRREPIGEPAFDRSRDKAAGPGGGLADRMRAPGGELQAPVDPDQPEVASAMTETNKAYDRGDYDGARTMAMKLLGQEPGNVRMLRVVVSSSCIMGDAEVATQYWRQLPPADQQQMSIRCSRYQVTFPPGASPQK
jgi:hypothetical protein